MSIINNIDIPILTVNRKSYLLLHKNTYMSIGQRLKLARKESGLTQKELAAKVGISQPTLSDLEKGESKGTGFIASLAAALGVNALWLETGRGTKSPSQVQPVKAVHDEDENADIIHIRKVNLRLSAGIVGFAIESVLEDSNPIYFRREWFERRGYLPANLIATGVKGPSMEPGLYDGDTVVVNTADRNPVDGEVYAINYEGEDVIKRLVRDAGTWWLSSDNPDQRRYPRKECNGDMCLIIGKVIHKQSERI